MITQQQILERFMHSLSETEKSGTAALDEAIDCATKNSAAHFSTIAQALAAMKNDIDSADDAENFLEDFCGIDSEESSTTLVSHDDLKTFMAKLTQDDIARLKELALPSAQDDDSADGAGNIFLHWFTKQATSDVIISDGSEDDTIHSYGSNVIISGGEGHDIIICNYMSQDNDYIMGYDSEDTIYARSPARKNVIISGGFEDDTICNYSSNATIGGGAGNDYITDYDDSNDRIYICSPARKTHSTVKSAGKAFISMEDGGALTLKGDNDSTIDISGDKLTVAVNSPEKFSDDDDDSEDEYLLRRPAHGTASTIKSSGNVLISMEGSGALTLAGAEENLIDISGENLVVVVNSPKRHGDDEIIRFYSGYATICNCGEDPHM